MKSFSEQAQFYGQYHQKKATLYSHLIGVPLIIFSLMVLLGFVKIIVPSVFATTLAGLTTLGMFIYYLLLNWRLTLLLAPVLIILLWLSTFFSHAGPTATGLWVFAITFIAGWTAQLAGHVIEGKRPALADNLVQALVAPLFLVAEVCFMAGYMTGLKKELHPEM
ncbi:DUF962 domain-containing protein [Legionella dresdenensis]|uniref:DUF962 domain-containing protein n=1 Tax=Legionella dresdenensis TaxID=450200 RepID=A0ABV8CDS5_9GAMM